MSKLLGKYTLGKYTFPQLNYKHYDPVYVYVYDDKIEMEVWKLKHTKDSDRCVKNGLTVVDKSEFIIKRKLMKFHYSDLLLMNETLNKIMRS